MKIGINSRIYQQSSTGIPYYIKCLYNKLSENQDKFSFIFFQTSLNKKIGDTKIIKGPNTGLFGALFDLFFINCLIKKERVDIFHGPSNILPFFKIKGIKYIVTIHDLSFLVFPKNHSLFFNLYYKYGIKRSLKNADVVIAQSENTKKDILNFYKVSEEKIRVIYSGINKLFLEETKEERIIKEKYFFSLTTHPKRKNILSVLEVMSRDKELIKHKYLIAGLIGENQTAELKDAIKKLELTDNVILWGYASEDQLVNFYQNAVFFIYPSFYEGFGFPALEAMACKCPVITSKNSSLIEITPNKNWLINPYDLKDIYNKMVEISNLEEKEREKLINDNYNFSKQFSWDKAAKEYAKLFDCLK